ncbi:hypothetical protein HKX48_007128 [Thoreauomyces humboldtii]|nr:hypothetical protein HKX48_007128 [Thoreauomyces humboldtii]
MTVTHIVQFKVLPEVDIAAFETAIRTLTEIPQVKKFTFGKTFTTERAQGFTHVFVMEFASRADLDTYNLSAEHVHVVKTHILPAVGVATGVLVLDIET